MNEALFEHRKRQQEARERGLPEPGGLTAGRIPLERRPLPRQDLSYPHRQRRLDAIQPAVSSTPGGSSGIVDPHISSPKEAPAMPHITRSWAPDYLVRAFFAQDVNWITAAGETIPVKDMKLDHVANTLLMLERTVEDFPFAAEDLQSQPLYQALYARLMEALTGLDRPESVQAAEHPADAWRGAQTGRISCADWLDRPVSIQALLESAMPTPGTLSKRVVIDYEDADGERGLRTIEVYSIQTRRGEVGVRPYVVAKNIDKGEMRTYRLDRIKRARLAR
jgi:hypothetical protein